MLRRRAAIAAMLTLLICFAIMLIMPFSPLRFMIDAADMMPRHSAPVCRYMRVYAARCYAPAFRCYHAADADATPWLSFRAATPARFAVIVAAHFLRLLRYALRYQRRVCRQFDFRAELSLDVCLPAAADIYNI